MTLEYTGKQFEVSHSVHILWQVVLSLYYTIISYLSAIFFPFSALSYNFSFFCVSSLAHEGCFNVATFRVIHLEGPGSLFWQPCCNWDRPVS